jgi:hypothetical protein
VDILIRGFGFAPMMLVLAIATGVPPVPAQQPPPAPRFDTAMTPPPPQSPPPYGAPAPNDVYPTAAYGFAPGSAANDPMLRRLPSAGGPTGDPGGPPLMAAAPQMLDAPTPPAKQLFELGKIIAWVGDQPIQNGDIMPTIEQTLAPAAGKDVPRRDPQPTGSRSTSRRG